VRRALRSAILLFVVAFVAAPGRLAAQSPPAASAAVQAPLTRDQMREFLLKARVIRARDLGKGVTRPRLLTLTDGTTTHTAVFQTVDERQMVANLQGSRGASTELNFVDSYRYNLGAEAVAALLGIDYMMPVHVERRWNGRIGSLSWFVESIMDEGERLKKGVTPPDPLAWNLQMYRMRVFSALVRDTDRNLTNVLITPEWKIVMIDFSRAFRLQAELPNVKDLPKCDRALFEKLPTLTKEAIQKAAGHQLTGFEIDALLKRRDLLVAHFQQLITEKGEAEVLY
jgi:hypothetical protein